MSDLSAVPQVVQKKPSLVHATIGAVTGFSTVLLANGASSNHLARRPWLHVGFTALGGYLGYRVNEFFAVIDNQRRQKQLYIERALARDAQLNLAMKQRKEAAENYAEQNEEVSSHHPSHH